MEFSPPKSGTATFLVVDDDALITLNAVDQLIEQGHVALEAFSGREALGILEQRPDITALITDYSMPGMNGVELAQAARQLRPGLPVLLVSGYSELPEGTPTDLMRLEKPYHEEDLARQIEELLASLGADRA